MSEPAEVSSDNPMPGRIDILPANNAFRDRYRFVATDADGAVILQGDEFTSTMLRPSDGKTERAMLQGFIAELGIRGWQAVPSGSRWFEHRLYNVGRGNVPVAATTAQQRGGMSMTAMWGWTLAVVILLFVICIVLAFTSEIRISPA